MTNDYYDGFAIYYTSSHEHEDERNNRHPFRFMDLEEEMTQEKIDRYYQRLPDWVIEDLVMSGLGDVHRYPNDEWSSRKRENFADAIYSAMNNYNRNPLATNFHAHYGREDIRKGQDWMDEHEVHHTSMSMGDLVVFEKTVDSTDGPVTIQRFLYCQGAGWAEFTLV